MMKKIFSIAVFAALLSVGCSDDCVSSRAIQTVVPERPAGQTDMVAYAAPAIDTVRVGFIGLGMRGPGAVERFIHIPGTKIVALCDLLPGNVAKCQKMLEKAGLPAAAEYSGSEEAWQELCQRNDIDLVYIATDWKHHAIMGVYAMEQGKHVAIEVPSAMTLDEIWALINTSERTRKHCIQLENCVYDFFEMNTLHMAQQGVFGEILHVEGSYIHNLKEFWPYYWNNWRLEYNQEHRGDVYATHGMGPACQLLDMHRGDRMTTLVSMDTKAVNGPAYIEETTGQAPESFANGDHTMTMIRTQKGKTIHIQHDVVTPRPYSRMYQLTGTKGFANKYPVEGYALEADQLSSDEMPDHEDLSAHGFLSPEQHDVLVEKYMHPIIREVGDMARAVGGHGGMDFIMDYRLVYCLRNGLPLDMDVYDLAEWCCLAPLSALSIENGSAPVEVPDFTRGAWNRVKGFRHAFAE
ncbi:Gfo/Idh/MocA family protein [Alistipes sp. An116]|uniref:Gfo/Idh/MocA family protein n=1 Tax=Alistipes sp. An116 TaxID=1965546 RepID=UPI001EF4809F|nr:Gfo/Idh/MocA family oxidoreductase [Alistipes sp. An116]